MTSLHRALLLLGVLGVIAGAVPFGLALVTEGGHQRWLIAAAGPITGWTFIGTGLWLWWRRPTAVFGPLLVGVGFSACVAALRVSTDPVIFITGLALIGVPYVGLYHMLLAFPDGNLERPIERWLVGIGYVSAVVVHPLSLLFQDTAARGLPANPLLISAQPVITGVVGRSRAAVAVLLILLLGWLVLTRWHRATPSQRRQTLPVLLTGGLVLALLGAWYAGNLGGLPSDLLDRLEEVRVAALAVVPLGFLAGVLHSRVAAAGLVSDLVARFSNPFERPHELRDALADALEDPDLALAYWLPDEARYVDGAGHDLLLPAGSARTATVVERDGRRIAAIVHDADVEPERAHAVAAAVSLALENERLSAELRARLEDLRASQARMVQAADDERRRIERNLHDGTQQRLTSISMSLGLAESRVLDDPHAAEAIRHARRELAAALAELRALSHGIHPAVLTTRGLIAAIEDLALAAPLPVSVQSNLADRLPEAIEVGSYYVIAEALANAAKHAAATHVLIDVAARDGAVTIVVSDDGAGGADPGKGTGLRGLRDRVIALGGSLEVTSPRGRGTRLTAIVPCA